MTLKEAQSYYLYRLIDLAGGRHNLAEGLGVDIQNVNNWVFLGRISKPMAIKAEEVYKMQKQLLRPEIKDWEIRRKCKCQQNSI